MATTANAPSQSTSPCKIINKTNFDVIVLSPNGIGSPDTVYKTSNGSSVIPRGTSASLSLDPTQLYNLIICTSSSLFPIANLAVSSDFTTGAFADQTVAQADYVAMTNAAAFQQAILACPDSQMAADYTAAVTKASAAPDVTTGDQIMQAFFQGTSGYKAVTADQVTAIATYYNQFPVVWAEASQNVTYYLYSSNGTANSFNGTVTFSLSGAIDITKPNCGYSCVFAAAKTPTDTTSTAVDTSKTKTLTYSNGVFADNPDTPNISLSGTFQLKSRLTQDPTDSMIITALAGKLGGTSVMGFDSAQLPAAAASEPETWEDVLDKVFSYLGDLLTVMFLGQLMYGAGKFLKKKYNETFNPEAKKLTPEEQIQKLREESADANKKLSDLLDKNFKRLQGPEAKPLRDPVAAVKEAGKSAKNVDSMAKRVKLKKVVLDQADTLQKVAKSEGAMTKDEINQLNTQEKSLRQSNAELAKKVDPNTVDDLVKTQTAAVEKVQTNIKTLTNSVDTRISVAQKNALSKSQADTDQLIDDMNKVEDQAKEVAEGKAKPDGEGEMGEISEGEKVLSEVHV